MEEIAGKNMAILGGTGTLGRALVEQLVTSAVSPKKVLIISRDEIKQWDMMQEYPSDGFPFLDFKLGDVRDADRMKELLKGMHFVIHAAAIKHVVMAERNPEECNKTNVQGTQNVLDALDPDSLEKALLISTDKAVDPIGVYGKSKQEAEKQWLSYHSQKRHAVVRLGNIIGARGSVFEAFEKQRKTGVIKVTHPDATRFCISPKEAARFTLRSLFETGAEIRTPSMEAFNVLQLAKEIAPECEIEIVGLREGDKLHEELNGVSSATQVKEEAAG